MAEGQTLYDAQGNKVGTFATDAPGMFIMDTPDSSAAAAPAPAHPAVAPGASNGHQAAATTQRVQGMAEEASAGEIEGGDTHVPFGPTFAVSEEDLPGYRITWTPEGARRTFRIAPSIGLMPLLRFAHAAKAGMDTDDLEGMAALYDMIADCVHPDDWPDFMAYATEVKAEDEELMEFVSAAMEIITARPRKRRGSSSATSPATSQRSRGNSSLPGSVIPPGAITPPELDGLMPVRDLVN